MKFVFVADFFAEDVAGGGELNNEEAISLLREEFEVIKKKSALIDLSFLKKNKDSFFIVSGFLGMRPDVKQALINDHKYIIYEHDHKYLKSRNPAPYENFLAPKTEIVNFDLYKKSKAVLVQTSFHKQIMKKNLEIEESNVKSFKQLIKTPKKSVIARSEKQSEYIKALKENDIVMSLGPAGTGKSFLAVSVAVTLLIEKKIDLCKNEDKLLDLFITR